MRELCELDLERQSGAIGGPDKIVEIDESLFSKRQGNAGRMLPQQWVFGGICRETRECFLERVADRTAQTLIAVIRRRILPGSIIYSDCWRGYSRRDLEESGYTHLTVNHTYNFVDPITGAHTQHIERLWGLAKWRNKRHRGTARHHMDSYFAEFMWRNTRRVEDIFTDLLRAMAEIFPPE